MKIFPICSYCYQKPIKTSVAKVSNIQSSSYNSENYINDLSINNFQLSKLFINTISFSRKPVQIYAIDPEGNYQGFNSAKEASEELGISSSSISMVLSGKLKQAKGCTFVRVGNVEFADA